MGDLVALITGACSGIGLALTQGLLDKGYSVVMADLNPPPKSSGLDPSKTLYIRADVASWDDQASLFKEAFAWKSQLNVVALNAGNQDHDDIFNSIDTSTPPTKPNMTTFDVNLLGVYYGIKLAAHYMARNSTPGGNIILTASTSALYAIPTLPQYSASKAGVVGLTRALAPMAVRAGVTINAVCPGVVVTGMIPQKVKETFPEDQLTPVGTIVKGFEYLLALNPDGSVRNGRVVEAAIDQIIPREEVPQLGVNHDWMSPEIAELWMRTYIERNVKLATEWATRSEE